MEVEGAARERNKAVVRRLVDEVVNGRNMATLSDLVAADFASFAPMRLPPGPAGYSMMLRATHVMYPDAQTTVERLVAEEDTVVAQEVTAGARLGAFPPGTPLAPLSGMERPFRIAQIIFYRFREGKIVEVAGLQDRFGLIEQFGGMVVWPER